MLEDTGKDGKAEVAADTAGVERDLEDGALSPSTGSGLAVTVRGLTPGFRLSKEKGHKTPSVDSNISVGTGGIFFSSDRCISS